MFKRKNQIVFPIKAKNPEAKKQRSRYKKFVWGFVILIIGAISWMFISGMMALKNISAQNSSKEPNYFIYGDNIPPDLLKNEGDGRINVLLIGIGGANHPGGLLADTLQIYSLDPINNELAVLSVPRDLYVNLSNGSKAKINSAYATSRKCSGARCSANTDYGAEELKDVMLNNLGIQIHYFIRVDFKGFEKFIDSIGGVEINVERALNDPLFPDEQMRGYAPLYISAGLQKMDGKKALKYARSRETTSDFDRSRRQQQILSAVKEKILKINFLANPVKVSEAMNILGAHMKTDFRLEEMIRFANIASKIPSSKSTNYVLDTSNNGPLKGSKDNIGSYIIIPKKGLNDFSEVQEYIRTILKEPFVMKEKAKILLINASGNVKTAQKVEKLLKDLGYNIVETRQETTVSRVNKIGKINDNEYSFNFLKKRFNAIEDRQLSKYGREFDIVLTIGQNYQIQ